MSKQEKQDEVLKPDPSTPLRSAQDDKMDEGDVDRCEKCEEYLAGWKRAQADYANLKKESEKARIDIVAYANENLLHELLPAMDQFETAMEHLPDLSTIPEESKVKFNNWLMGIKAVKQLWEQTFSAVGLERVETAGVFDPNKHFAVGKEEDVSQPPDTVLRVVRQGWSLNGKALRPANVIVNSITN